MPLKDNILRSILKKLREPRENVILIPCKTNKTALQLCFHVKQLIFLTLHLTKMVSFYLKLSRACLPH